MSTVCRSCGASLIWAITVNGDPIPLDAEPSKRGTVRLEPSAPGAETQLAVYVPDTDRPKYAGRLYLAHSVTCAQRRVREVEKAPNHHMVGVCPECGGACDNRAKRCQRCYEGRGRDPEKRRTGWAEARDLYSLGQCGNDGCEKPAVERHHLDGNPLNNAPENVLCVCRRCHMVLDGRIERLKRRPEPDPGLRYWGD